MSFKETGMKQFYIILALMVAAPFGGLAATPEAVPIETLNAALIATMKAGSAKIGFRPRYDALAPVIRATLNLPLILRNSVGFRWPSLSSDQQQELAAAFERYTVSSYVDGFSRYSGQRIEVLAAEKALGPMKIVESEIISSDGSARRLDYVMAEGDTGWQVADVLLDGTISKVAVQTSDFSALVKRGDASALIAALRAKIANLSGGVLKD
jgi:phospholipid transport system substrate-binding protein